MASDVSQGAGSYQGNASAGAAFVPDDDWNVTVLECNKVRMTSHVSPDQQRVPAQHHSVCIRCDSLPRAYKSPGRATNQEHAASACQPCPTHEPYSQPITDALT